MTTDRQTWHASPAELGAYADGSCAPVLALSLEAHLVRCARCRATLAAQVGPGDTDRRWDRLADAVDRPSRGFLGRLGLDALARHSLLRSALASPDLRWAWLAALVLVVVLPLATGALPGADGSTMLLALAPVAPACAVALSYRSSADPAGELALAAPAAGLRVVAMRALTVCAAAVPLSLGVSLLHGMPLGVALAWVLPGAALAALVLLAGTTRVDPLHAAAALSVLWALGVVAPSTTRALARQVVVDTVTSPALQTSALAVCAAAALLTVARRDAIAYRRTA